MGSTGIRMRELLSKAIDEHMQKCSFDCDKQGMMAELAPVIALADKIVEDHEVRCTGEAV